MEHHPWTARWAMTSTAWGASHPPLTNLPSLPPPNAVDKNKQTVSGGIHMKPTYSPRSRGSSTPKLSVMWPSSAKVSSPKFTLILHGNINILIAAIWSKSDRRENNFDLVFGPPNPNVSAGTFIAQILTWQGRPSTYEAGRLWNSNFSYPPTAVEHLLNISSPPSAEAPSNQDLSISRFHCHPW